MDKLNNKGFALSTLLIFISLFMIILVVVMIIAYNNGVERNSEDKAFIKEGTMFVSPEEENK